MEGLLSPEGIRAHTSKSEGKESLGAAFEWTGLERRDDSFYDPLRQMLRASGLGSEDLID
jgi:hypothetical protein